jgi:hypothetical protein
MTATEMDQDAIRVANKYAAGVEKATTFAERAHACREAAYAYRRDARENLESAEQHRAIVATTTDPNVAHLNAQAARKAEEEAAREILAARYYDDQANRYEAKISALNS